jgi:hypothetical protein
MGFSSLKGWDAAGLNPKLAFVPFDLMVAENAGAVEPTAR